MILKDALTSMFYVIIVRVDCFLCSRSASPINGFMILNRLGLNDMIEPINRNLEFQLQDPFLLYRNGQGEVMTFFTVSQWSR